MTKAQPVRRRDLSRDYPTKSIPSDWYHIFNSDFRNCTDVVRKRTLRRSIRDYIESRIGVSADQLLANYYVDEKWLDKQADERLILASNKMVKITMESIEADIVADMVRQAFPVMNAHKAQRIFLVYLEYWREDLKKKFQENFKDGDQPKIAALERRAKKLANIITPDRFPLEETEPPEETEIVQFPEDRTEAFAYGNTQKIEADIR